MRAAARKELIFLKLKILETNEKTINKYTRLIFTLLSSSNLESWF